MEDDKEEIMAQGSETQSPKWVAQLFRIVETYIIIPKLNKYGTQDQRIREHRRDNSILEGNFFSSSETIFNEREVEESAYGRCSISTSEDRAAVVMEKKTPNRPFLRVK